MAEAHDRYSELLKVLRTREGMTVERVIASGPRLADLLTAPAVAARAAVTAESSETALIGAVRVLVRAMPAQVRLVLDAALRLELTLDPSDPDHLSLYASELMNRRNALLANWNRLHEIAGADEIPAAPSATLLRTRIEDEALAALARSLVVGDATVFKRPADDDAIGRAYVFGAAVTDHIYRVDEPLDLDLGSAQASDYTRQPGGKGLVQAVALRRAGFEVELLAAVGSDAAGNEITQFLHREGIGVSHLARLGATTPHVNLITNEQDGRTFAVAWPNAAEFAFPLAQAAELCARLGPDDTVFFTFELEDEELAELILALDRDPARRPLVFVTPGPPPRSNVLDYAVFSRIDVLVAHRRELERLAPADDQLAESKDRADYLRSQMGVGTVAVCDDVRARVFYLDDGQLGEREPTITTYRESAGARQAFTAALAARIVAERASSPGRPVQIDRAAFEYASAALAVTALQKGAASGLPTAREIANYLERN